jgi:bacterioferritin-associated ferredoxin
MMCRCEDVTREKILACIADGYETPDEIKRVTRAGMGPCQGRACRQLIASELSRIFAMPMDEVLTPTFRPPVKPISLGALADAYTDADVDNNADVDVEAGVNTNTGTDTDACTDAEANADTNVNADVDVDTNADG